jgi:glyoxalase family protein
VASSVLGIHHVTAIAADPQQSINFYTQVLGLRLVKVTVDAQDQETYHLVFGTGIGKSGTLLSFYCWPGAIRGRSGTGQVQSTGLGVPPESLQYWRERLTSENVAVDGPARRAGFQSLSFRDRDGLLLELVADDAAFTWEAPWSRAIPHDRAIRGLHGITISAGSSVEWERFLTGVLGLHVIAEDAHSRSYVVQGGSLGAHIVVRALPYVGRGVTTVGYVHHAAFRVPDDELGQWQTRAAEYTETLGPAEDHVYYRAVHLEGPEGIRLQLASDGPGVTVDELPEELGTRLVLPPWLEPRRPYIEQRLPPLRLPGATR